MKFTKMHGIGNDYVYVDARTMPIDDPVSLAQHVSDRHSGIGSDGLILIKRSDMADVAMAIYNADGSRAQMCGNGIRCVAKYVVDHGIAVGPELDIETDAGVKRACLVSNDGHTATVRVDMGEPSLEPAALPSTISGPSIIDYSLDLGDTVLAVTCVSMGNPHAVVFMENLESLVLSEIGPKIENAPEFPERINAHFVEVVSDRQLKMMTWERGSGATNACGTGACAVCVAGSLTGRSAKSVVAELPGGSLDVEWGRDGHVSMTGPAVEVFSGDWLGGLNC